MDLSVGDHLFLISHMLMIAGRMADGVTGRSRIQAMDQKLKDAVDAFDRVISVENFLQVKKNTGEHSFLAMLHSQLLHIELKLLHDRLKPVNTNYVLKSCCTADTRKFILDLVADWASKNPGEEGSKTYWIYGSPGIGKTALAHSICCMLHDQRRLAGTFFCQWDHERLNNTINILPTLMYQLAEFLPLFRGVVAQRLHDDPRLTPDTMKESEFLELICKVSPKPTTTRVLVIDALDECAPHRRSPHLREILRALTNAAAPVTWLRIIITSRPEFDIRKHFEGPIYEKYNLDTDEHGASDVQIFAEERFKQLRDDWHLPEAWPESSLLEKAIKRAGYLFIFVETIARDIEENKDIATERLETLLDDSNSSALEPLHQLYLGILTNVVKNHLSEFQEMIGAVLVAAPYRPLCREAIVELKGLNNERVTIWVAGLASLLDTEADGGIRVRHLSVSDFFTINCPENEKYRPDLQRANVLLGAACLKRMVEKLRFNICDLSPGVANKDVPDLPSRIKDNIPDTLQYSSLYWSNHLCCNAAVIGEDVWGDLKKLFEGPIVLFWIEVLSIMGMVRISIPSLQMIWAIVKVSTGHL